MTIILVSHNAEGKVISPNFVFTPTNWNTWQTATVKGRPSGHEGLNPYTILTSGTISTDPKYSGHFVGVYTNQSLVVLNGLNSFGLWDWVYWSYAGHTECSNTITLSGNLLKNGVVVSVSDSPLQVVGAALAGLARDSLSSGENDERTAILESAAVDAALSLGPQGSLASAVD